MARIEVLIVNDSAVVRQVLTERPNHVKDIEVIEARNGGAQRTGSLMTGMGDGGARGLREMREVGARTLAQDEQNRVVYGMPKKAVTTGAVERSLTPSEIPAAIMEMTNHE